MGGGLDRHVLRIGFADSPIRTPKKGASNDSRGEPMGKWQRGERVDGPPKYWLCGCVFFEYPRVFVVLKGSQEENRSPFGGCKFLERHTHAMAERRLFLFPFPKNRWGQ